MLLPLQPCPDDAENFRDVQCANTNDIPFNGVLYSWEAFTGPGEHYTILIIL